MVGVVQSEHLATYAYTTTAIKQAVSELCQELDRRSRRRAPASRRC